MSDIEFIELVRKVRACSLCASQLVDGVRPVLQVHRDARILVAGQAPGSKVHVSGVPFDDASGERLRQWMGIDKETFYNPEIVAILPMGFCYPGKGRSGDLPPMPICAETWRTALLAGMPNIKLRLVIGQYAQAWHLSSTEKNLTETVKNWKDGDKGVIPLPHPSPRNNIWLKKNPWFERDLVPEVQRQTQQALNL